MKKLKDLTPEECVQIASIAEPDVEWKFVRSVCKWDGFDLIEKECKNENISKYIFQIDYRSDEELGSVSRFRFYEDLHLYPLSEDIILRINNYLKY
jgi:hypothetical protein